MLFCVAFVCVHHVICVVHRTSQAVMEKDDIDTKSESKLSKGKSKQDSKGLTHFFLSYLFSVTHYFLLRHFKIFTNCLNYEWKNIVTVPVQNCIVVTIRLTTIKIKMINYGDLEEVTKFSSLFVMYLIALYVNSDSSILGTLCLIRANEGVALVVKSILCISPGTAGSWKSSCRRRRSSERKSKRKKNRERKSRGKKRWENERLKKRGHLPHAFETVLSSSCAVWALREEN